MLTKILVVAGNLLVWFPLLAPIIISVAAFTRAGVFRFDYLMPAELFPFALIGCGLLFWASKRAHIRQKLIGWGFLVAAGMLVGGQVLAVVTGLASGEIEPVGWPWIAVMGTLIIYILALVAVGVGGIFLLRRPKREPIV